MPVLDVELLDVVLITFDVVLLQEVFSSDRMRHPMNCEIDVVL